MIPRPFMPDHVLDLVPRALGVTVAQRRHRLRSPDHAGVQPRIEDRAERRRVHCAHISREGGGLALDIAGQHRIGRDQPGQRPSRGGGQGRPGVPLHLCAADQSFQPHRGVAKAGPRLGLAEHNAARQPERERIGPSAGSHRAEGAT